MNKYVFLYLKFYRGQTFWWFCAQPTEKTDKKKATPEGVANMPDGALAPQ
ncbi:hypothetical protein [Photobacterium sp. GSS17]|nr:hypothetical protein [Photobacterium sp. GSS17]